jgi:hypothetical protein
MTSLDSCSTDLDGLPDMDLIDPSDLFLQMELDDLNDHLDVLADNSDEILNILADLL